MIGDAPLAALLAGAELPAGSGPELRSLADVLAGLRGPASSDELAGLAETLAAFRDQFRAPDVARRRRARRPPERSRPVRAAAVTAAAMVLSLGGIATVAYAGALPTGLQRLAHDIVGAPAPAPRPVVTPSSWTAPAAAPHRGPAYGLCSAWAHARADGTREQQATAFRKLAAAAGGRSKVTAYCGTAVRRGTSPSPSPRPQPTPTSQHHGKPSGLPTPHNTGKPSGTPTPHHHGKPSGRPTPHSTGKPSGASTPHNTGGS